MNLRDKIIKNVFFSWAYYLISFISGIFLMPFMVHHLGDTIYGIWILILSMAGYMGFFDLGIRGSIVKYVAELNANNKQAELNKLISTSFFTYSFIATLIFSITIIASIYFTNLFRIDPSLIYEGKLVLLLVGFSIAISFPMAVFGSVIWGLQRHDIFSTIELIVFLIRTILIIISILLGFKLVALAIITLTTTILANGVRIYYSFKINPGLKVHFKLIDCHSLKLVFNYAFFVFIIGIGTRIISCTNPLIIGAFMSAAMITHYSVGFRLVDYARDIVSVMTSVLVPTASELDAKKEFAKMRKLLILGTKYSFILTLPISLVFIIMGRPLISLWMGKNYTSSAIILVILIIPQVFSISQHISNVILQGTGKLKTYTILIICETLFSLLLSLVLIKNYGLIGVALGAAIPFTINKGIILPIYICKVLKQNFIEYIKRSAVKPLIASIPCILLLLLFRESFYPNTIFTLMIEITISFLTYFILAINLSVDKTERKNLWQSVVRMLPGQIFIKQKM